MKYPIDVPDDALKVIRLGIFDDDHTFEYLSAVSSCTGIPPYSLYIVGNRVHFLGEELMMGRSIQSSIRAVWESLWNKRSLRRAVGVGHYADFYMNQVDIDHGAVIGSAQAVLVMSIPLGRTVQSFREQIRLGERSIRQTYAVVPFSETLLEYWRNYREVEVRGTLMSVKHVCEGDLAASLERLEVGLVPRRRYNTPAMRRRPNSDSAITITDRVAYKWMAMEILRGIHFLLSIPLVDEREVEVDKRGVLHVPISSPEVEYGFSSLWLKIEERWGRIRDVVAADLPTDSRYERLTIGISYEVSGREYSESIDSEIAIVSPSRDVVTVDRLQYRVLIAD